jgi:hypothetical protein
LKWFADFRDPWTTIGYHPYDCLIMRIKAQSTGASVLNTADTIIVTSKTTKAEFQAITNKQLR